jgi:sirohydrochlorin ferrochelatase
MRGVCVKTAVVILGHGSRSGGADQAIKRIAAEVKRAGNFGIVEHAFLQYVQPTLPETLETCLRQGANNIVIVPFFMQPGAHVTKDIPAFLGKARKQHPNLGIIVTDFVGNHPLMTEIVLDLVKKSDCGMRNAECGMEKQQKN